MCFRYTFSAYFVISHFHNRSIKPKEISVSYSDSEKKEYVLDKLVYVSTKNQKILFINKYKTDVIYENLTACLCVEWLVSDSNCLCTERSKILLDQLLSLLIQREKNLLFFSIVKIDIFRSGFNCSQFVISLANR